MEPPFQIVRLRTNAARQFKRVEHAEAMVWKLLMVAEQTWRKLNAPWLLQAVYDGRRVKDGVAVRAETDERKAG